MRDTDERGDAGLPGGSDGTADWKLLIMGNLLTRTWRFNELRKDLDGISRKGLTDSLRAVEKDEIVIRTVYPEVPPRVEYAFSELGESMRPIIQAWSNGASLIKPAENKKSFLSSIWRGEQNGRAAAWV